MILLASEYANDLIFLAAVFFGTEGEDFVVVGFFFFS